MAKDMQVFCETDDENKTNIPTATIAIELYGKGEVMSIGAQDFASVTNRFGALKKACERKILQD